MTRGQRARGRKAAAVLASCLALATVVACGSEPLGPDVEPEVEELVSLVNAFRDDASCAALTWSAPVAEVAQAHSADMVARSFFAHDNPDGQSPFDRLTAAGIGYSRAAENIASGYPTASAVLEGWIGSPGHRANLANCSLTQHGIGHYQGRWTHVFVTP